MPADTVYDARAVASYLVGKAAARGLDALQAMKLTYIAHGFTLAVLGKPLLEDDVEAWKYGPAIRRLYAVLPPGWPTSVHGPSETDPGRRHGAER